MLSTDDTPSHLPSTLLERFHVLLLLTCPDAKMTATLPPYLLYARQPYLLYPFSIPPSTLSTYSFYTLSPSVAYVSSPIPHHHYANVFVFRTMWRLNILKQGLLKMSIVANSPNSSHKQNVQ